LLDVNVLVALLWRTHVHHHPARAWLEAKRSRGIRTCPLTQAGAIRILSNPRYSRDWLAVGAASQALDDLLNLREHVFWPDDLAVGTAISETGPLTGHQQITDVYLLALAKAHGGVLATFDRGVLALSGAAEHAELISY
jgi:toxin-antitoxin system PIN domain toxin